MKNNLLLIMLMTLCLSSCKNTGSNDKSSSNDKTEEELSKTEVGSDGTQNQDSSQPLLSATDLMKVYDQIDDTTYFKNNFSNKGLKVIVTDDYKNEESVPDGVWFTEVWGHNMAYDGSKDLYEQRFTPEADDAIALVVNHTDDADACIYFSNPAYLDIYQKQIEELGLIHYTGEDFDIWAREGYKHGEEVEKVFCLGKEELNDKLYHLIYSFDV